MANAPPRRRNGKPAGKPADDPAADDPPWDRKRGMPKDQGLMRTVERASSRYSASEQSEEKQKSRGGR
jgi:hypothetical protein